LDQIVVLIVKRVDPSVIQSLFPDHVSLVVHADGLIVAVVWRGEITYVLGIAEDPQSCRTDIATTKENVSYLVQSSHSGRLEAWYAIGIDLSVIKEIDVAVLVCVDGPVASIV
jgi:hypothetical protein